MKNLSKSDFMINGNPVIFIDGLVGGGKTLVSNLIGSIKDVEWWSCHSKFEQICNLDCNKKIEKDVASSLLVKFYNELYYDNLILRHSNFRKQDVSSIYNHPRQKEILNRIKYSDSFASKKVKKAKLILPFMTHFNTISSATLFRSFGNKLVYVYLTRNPYNIYTLNHLANWTDTWKKKKNRYGAITYYDKLNGQNIPAFIYNHKKEYLKINKYEKAILILKYFCDYNLNLRKMIKLKKKYKSKLIIIPYEKLTIDPVKYVKKLTKSLNKKIDDVLLKSLKENKLPRKSNFVPKGINPTFEYNWKKNNNQKNLKFDQVDKFIKKKVSKKYFLEICNLNIKYNKFIKNLNEK